MPYTSILVLGGGEDEILKRRTKSKEEREDRYLDHTRGNKGV
jgi:hypothetical protein